MRILTQGLLTTIITVGFMGVPANAETAGCEGAISNTGEGSYNEVTCKESNKLTVTCKNGIYVLNDNNQTSSSGQVDANKNTSVGDVSTGNAVNENGTTVKIGASCGEKEHGQVTAPPVVGGLGSTTPPSGGAGNLGGSTSGSLGGGAGSLGGGMGSVVVPSSTPVTVAELPNTASNPIATAVTIGTVGLAGLFGLSRLALLGYGRFLMR